MQQPGTGTRGRGWHLAAGVLFAAGLWLVNVEPGWESAAVLTPEFGPLVRVINIALALGLVSSVLDFARWPSMGVRSLCHAALATFALVSLARLVVHFPFEVTQGTVRIVVRAAIAAAMVGAFVGLVAALGSVARDLHVHSHLQGRRRRP